MASFGKKIKKFFVGEPGKFKDIPLYAPEQIAAQKKLLETALPALQSLIGQAQKPQQQFDFGPIEQQYTRQFQEQTVPSIAERFGALGQQGTASYKTIMGRAGTDLAGNLAALKGQYGLQQQGLGLQNQGQLFSVLSGLLGAGMGQRNQQVYMPGAKGLFGGAGEAALGAAPLMGAAGMGWPMAGGMGALGALLSAFGGR